MRNQIQLFRVLLFVMFVSLFFQSCIGSIDTQKKFAGGLGTQQNPFLISTIEHLQAIREEENLDKHYIQVRDIDASASKEFQNGSGFERIGDRESPFTGSYNGNGFTIDDLYLHSNKEALHVGVFGYVKEGVIKNVRVINKVSLFKENPAHPAGNANAELSERISIIDDDLFETSAKGFLVGFNEGGRIENCFVQGRVGALFIALGGLVGVNTGVIENSKFLGSVTKPGLAAGLVGINTGRIMDSSSGGRANGIITGGLVGRNLQGGEIIRSYTTSDVAGSGLNGGLVAFNSGRIASSYSKENGIRNSIGVIGGLAAQNNGEITDSYVITDIGAFLDQSTENLIGGLVGMNQEQGRITNSYAVGKMNTPDEGITAGLIGTNEGQVSAAYWDTETTGQSDAVGEGSPDGATGLTTQQMTGPAAEANMPGFDWVNVWRTTEGGYPVLWWEQE